MESDNVRDLLRRFHEGYVHRDRAYLSQFMDLFAASGDLEIIGTDAVRPGEGEWCLGSEAVRKLISGDWDHWGDVRFDVDGARISVRGEVAWLATTGTVTDTMRAEEHYHNYIEYVAGILKDPQGTPWSKVHRILGVGNDLVLGLPLGDTFVWPFRFTAVAVREEDGWRFRQMQFSFATTRAPDVRLERAP